MIRGFVTGFVMVFLVGVWARQQSAHAHAHCHRVTPTPDVIARASVQTDTILKTIERESPWILKPNAKLSNNSSAQF